VSHRARFRNPAAFERAVKAVALEHGPANGAVREGGGEAERQNNDGHITVLLAGCVVCSACA
jgi:hypothetical protein